MRCSLGDISISFDSGDGDVSFVSHAHSDHVNGVKGKKRIIASEETVALGGLKGSQVSHDNAEMFSAGHMLGARQIMVENQDGRTVYTGDISIRGNLITDGADIVQCDRLILDGTYNDPAYVFPDYEDVCRSMAGWIGSNQSCNLIIGGYDMGKAQELVRLINEYSGMAPIVGEKAGRICGVYRSFGVNLDYIVIGSEEAEEAMSRPFVAVVPMRQAKRYFAHRLSEAFGRKTLCAVATGWALREKFNTDAQFPLSDHADFNDLRKYIKESGAASVEFFC
ncbi:MAG: hypothetical protein ACP5NX_01825 [Candidatus Bilamarchaeaceae archaeon]